jgi:4-aminobutyrate aminotransferase-like enzyme
MLDRGVLIGTTGPLGNILKIRPPLTFLSPHVDVLLEALDQSLAHSQHLTMAKV